MSRDCPMAGGDSGGGGDVFSRLGKGGKGGGKNGRSAADGRKAKTPKWKKHVECYEDETTGDTLVRLYETDVVRITKKDIVLDSGGNMSEEIQACINDALTQYTFRVKPINGEWYVSDGKFRLYRYYDGVVISGAAKEFQEGVGAAAAGGGVGGPVRVVKSPGGRHRPY
mmetsp:Transcript_54357/g.140402  ORF Transcript_54357/g.140402 Transcript_54357/m.140402 type:complete len:169 (+) Transcript_54357:94-600(+)